MPTDRAWSSDNVPMTEDSPTQRAATNIVVRRAPGKDVDDIAGAGAGGGAQPVIETNRTGVQPHAIPLHAHWFNPQRLAQQWSGRLHF